MNGAVPVPGVTENVCEYAALCVAAGKVAGKITGTGFTTSVNDCCAMSPAASLTCTVKEEVPAAPVSVPESTPPPLSAIPVGGVPLTSDQV